MDFDQIVVKESPGLCRCCLSEGCYKDLGTEYSWMNETEVYADMLLECFDISISQQNDGPNGPNRLICEVCITRLRDACYFKKQVQETEKKFIDMVARGEFSPKVLIYQTQMKAELEAPTEEAEVEYLEDDMDFGDADDEPLRRSEPEPLASVSEVTADPLPIKGKRGRPRKTDKAAKKVKVEPKAKTSKALVKEIEDGSQSEDLEIRIINGDSIQKISRKLKRNKTSDVDDTTKTMRRNVLNVILNTTIMPFRWLKTSYRCFYCYEVFREPRDLKQHQEFHEDEDKLKSMNNFWEPFVNVDTSNMSCKLCDKVAHEFYALLDHLIDAHNITFNKDIGICMEPYKLNDISVRCVVCDKEYKTFGHLLVHKNKAHKGVYTAQVMCEICGLHCRNQNHLREHKKVHGNKSAICSICGVNLGSHHKQRSHMQNVHDKKYKCAICPELFETHYRRTFHMMTVHKSKEEIKCQHCSKTFVFRSSMLTHIRETHLRERNIICGICGFRTFNNTKLKRHMLKHSSERNFKCNICDKGFKDNKNLRIHIRNVHDGEDGFELHDQGALDPSQVNLDI